MGVRESGALNEGLSTVRWPGTQLAVPPRRKGCSGLLDGVFSATGLLGPLILDPETAQARELFRALSSVATGIPNCLPTDKALSSFSGTDSACS